MGTWTHQPVISDKEEEVEVVALKMQIGVNLNLMKTKRLTK
jgi:hypothetical protein